MRCMSGRVKIASTFGVKKGFIVLQQYKYVSKMVAEMSGRGNHSGDDIRSLAGDREKM